MKRKTTFSQKLTLVFGVSIAIVAVIFNLLWFYGSKNTVEKEYISSMENNIISAGRSLDLMIENLKSLSYAVVTNPVIIEELSKINGNVASYNPDTSLKIESILSNFLMIEKNIVGIQIMDNFGNYYSVNKKFTYTQVIEESAKNAFEQFTANNSENNIYYFGSEEEGAPECFSYMRNIKNPNNGEKLGNIKVDIDIGSVRGLLDSVFQSSDDFCLLSLQGKPLLTSNCQYNEVLLNYEKEKIYLEGKEFLRKARYLDYPELKIIYFFNEQQQSAQLFSMVIFNMVILVVVIAISFLFSYIASTLMTKNIKTLRKAMFKVAEGNLDVHTDIKSNDEFGVLSNNFNNMVLCLKTLYEQVYRLEIETKEASFKALQAKINPHFFFNTMECVNYFANSKENDKIIQLVGSLTKNFRYALETGDSRSIAEEIEHTKSYIEILSFRYPEKIEFELDSDENLNEFMIPKLTIQPLVENSIIHGILKKRGSNKVCLKIKQDETDKNTIFLSLRDDGIGICEEKLVWLNNMVAEDKTEENHIGIINTAKRLMLMFNGNVDFRIDSKEGEWTEIVIKICKERRNDNV